MTDPTEPDSKSGSGDSSPAGAAHTGGNGQEGRTAPPPPASGKLHGVRAPLPEAPEGSAPTPRASAAAAGTDKPAAAPGDATPAAPAPAAPAASGAAARPAAPAPAKHAPARAAEGGKAAPGLAAQLAKGGPAEQEPLVGSADFGWRVFEISMMVGLVALSAITLVSCWRMLRALFSVL